MYVLSIWAMTLMVSTNQFYSALHPLAIPIGILLPLLLPHHLFLPLALPLNKSKSILLRP